MVHTMCRPHWIIHDPSESKKSAQTVVPHNDQSFHRLVWDGTNAQLNGCRNCRYCRENLAYSSPTPTENCVWSWYQNYGEFSKMCRNKYGLNRKPIITRNPQPNAIIEQIHQTIGNIIRTFDVSNIVNNDPWYGIISATIFAVRENYHTTLQASPMQIVFFRDVI